MKYKILVLDLDGTLTNKKKEITGSHSSEPAFSDAVLHRMQHGRSTVCKLGLISQRNI